jgi:uncharacterized protein
MDIQFLLGGSIAIFLAFSVKSSTGLGSALIAVPILALAINFKQAVVFNMLFETVAGALLFYQCYKFVHWPVFIIVSIGSIIGVPLGTEILKEFSSEVIGVTIGTFAVGFGTMMLGVNNRCYRIHVKNKFAGLAAGFVGGLFKGMCGMGGPPITAYCNYVFEDKTSIRATLIAIFEFSSLMQMGLYFYAGLIPRSFIMPFVLLLPVFLIATFFGNKIFEKFNEGAFRKTIALIILLTGLLTLYKGVVQMIR